MNNNAYITLLSTNNYLYGCIGLMYSWKATNSKYPFYCVVTEDITKENIMIYFFNNLLIYFPIVNPK